jgi:hypothetical protein
MFAKDANLRIFRELCPFLFFAKRGELGRMIWRKVSAYGIGLLFICLSLYLYIQFTNHYKDTVMTMRTLKPLHPLQIGEVITDDNVQSVIIPTAAHVASAVTDLEAIRGKKVKVPMSNGEEFVAWKLEEAAITPVKGQRYYSFKTDALQNVANTVRRGDHVDVWVEFEMPRQFVDDQGKKHWVGSLKLLENLLVADVKGADGEEIVDAPEGNHAFQSVRVGVLQAHEPDLNLIRAKPNGKPEVNTYIMNEAEYNAYVIGALSGKIKLSLANVLAIEDKESRVTDLFNQLQDTDIFNKESKMQKIQLDPSVVKKEENNH